ncbi:MAG: penicillin-binding protein 2 [Candidatus Doudnabacteria bacterium]|nr:penicillin-binding protein 2 [Candidatus Doudnabacteria bacterium]
MNVVTNGKELSNSYNLRIFLLLSFLTAFIGLVVLRLFNLQVINHDYYQAIASGQHSFEQTILPNRGDIYLNSIKENPLLVATNIDKNLIYASPKEINDPINTASKLAPLLELTSQEIINRFAQGNPNYVVLQKQVSDEQADQIAGLGLIGIHSEPEVVRFYPENNLASHVLGFLGFQADRRVGQYGVEGRFDQVLSGAAGIEGIESDLAGRWITLGSRNFQPAENGDDIYLTIDPAIQLKAQEVLKSTVEQHGADRGSVVVINPKTGAILSLAVYPDFDPNAYNLVDDIGVYSNAVLAADYEPGSVFKPITMAAALNEGVVTPETTYEDTGAVELDEFTIRNSDGEAHGIQTMNEVLEKSLNTGAVFVEQQLGHKKFKKYVEEFGFGQLWGVDLPGEVLGNINNLNKKGEVFFGTASYGQGITVTPLQLIAAYTAIANGGKLMKPYIVDRMVHPDETVEQTFPEQVREVISPKTAATVSAMMVNVVENGHGKRAAVPGYYIAGKTGTAQVAYQDRIGYDPSKTIGSFVGFGPVDNPKFLMLVRIDNPKDVKFAESTAAPAFGEIASFILNYLQIPPPRD